MDSAILLMLYQEYGGKAFFEKNKDKAKLWLDKLKITRPKRISLEIYSYKEYKDLKLTQREYYVIFFCPGSLVGEGKEYFEDLKKHSIYQVGCCDHYTNVWQRFSDEHTGKILRYLDKYLIVQSEICAEKITARGFKGYYIVNETPEMNDSVDRVILDRSTPKSVIFITEWYARSGNYMFNLDEKSYEFQDNALKEFSSLVERNPHSSFGLRKHPQLKENNWMIPYSMDKRSNFVDYSNHDIRELITKGNIFIGIDSNLLLTTARFGCKTYSLKSSEYEFNLSDYEPKLIGIDSLSSINLKDLL